MMAMLLSPHLPNRGPCIKTTSSLLPLSPVWHHVFAREVSENAEKFKERS